MKIANFKEKNSNEAILIVDRKDVTTIANALKEYYESNKHRKNAKRLLDQFMDKVAIF